jgi:Cu(I)/Ag(I) efflux system membrane fusion protein
MTTPVSSAAPGTSPGKVPGSRLLRGARRLVLWGLFLAAVLVGLRYQEVITRHLQSLIPSPPPRKVLYWTSPHDPSVHADQPGKDAMGMDLVPVYAGQERPQGPIIIDPQLEEQDYTTAPVTRGPLVRTIRTVSTVTYAEPLIHDVTLKVDAWLEKLHIDYEGQPVHKGEPLLEVYAPDLVATQEELLRSLEVQGRAGLPTGDMTESNVELARRRLRYWDVSADQIEGIERTGQVRKLIRFRSPASGIVLKKQALEGKYVPAGQMLYRIADLSRVWVYAYAYPDQIHCVYEGQKATLTIPDFPDRTFPGKVIYIYPYLDPMIRAVKVRLEFANPDLLLKPDMFTRVELEPHRMGIGLSVPRRAVLDTGMRKLVYVAVAQGRFQPREIDTGMEVDGDRIEVLSGLSAGEQVVSPPEFLLDSESRLRLIDRKFEPLPPTMKMPAGKKPGQQGPMHHPSN